MGGEMTAEDVAFTVNRILDKGTSSRAPRQFPHCG